MLWVITRLEVIVVPIALALMLTALMIPAVDFLDRRGAPRGGAVALVLLERNRDRRRHADVRRQPVRHRPARTGRTGHPIHREHTHVADRRSRAPEQGPDHQCGQLGHRGAAQQSGQADQRCAVDGGHRDRNRHGRTACAVHPDLLPARRAQHLAVRHEDLPGERPGAGARCGPRRISSRSSAMCARRSSSRWSTPSGSAPAWRSWACRWHCRWRRSSSSVRSSRWSVRSSPDSSPSSSHCSPKASSTR